MAGEMVVTPPQAIRAIGKSSAVEKKAAILQSNYIPWKGYFDLIDQVDEFILYDDVQFTRRDWRNRNKIKTAHGPRWLTIPTRAKGRYHQKIKDVVACDSAWRRAHWRTIAHNYSRSPYFATYRPLFEELYLGSEERRLSHINHRFLIALCEILSISTRISRSMDYELVTGRTERLLDLCKQLGATEYVSGPAARAYLDEALFTQEGIRVRWMDYTGYPTYSQLHPPFEHHVSVIDLVFNEGEDAAKFIRRTG